MFNMKLLTLASLSLLLPAALTSPISTTIKGSLSTRTSITPPYPFPAGYLGPRAAAAAAAAAPSAVPGLSALALLTAHHLPDCLASDAGVDHAMVAGTCYKMAPSFLSYTARVLTAGRVVCKMHVYSAADCTGFESASAQLTGSMGKCTQTHLKTVDGLAGVGAVGAKVLCA